MTFNPPPSWPVSAAFSPTPDWEPDPAWPPAPPGWTFWVDEPHGAESAESRRPHRISRWALGLLIAIPIISVAVGIVVVNSWRSPTKQIVLTPVTLPYSPVPATSPSFIPDWPRPQDTYVHFASWAGFGGVDAQFTDSGRTVFLDTHDTTDTWRTKWSGLIQTGPPLCGFRLTGRVRDASHTVGVPGGFGIGMGELGPGDPASADLTGSAIQFDFGQNGYRLAIYPSDDDNGLAPAALDNHWHDIDLTVDAEESTLLVDGRQVAKTTSPGHCGHPVIRVWAGAAEFGGFRFAP
ncbi:hypothetical protein MHPYR_230065 [uncultured Mycobacterium sp.]|uniref:Uncharacterized protein n=1 Tax=uncultured Mycobacterium sp. TaxID=171292 RepID=A0A1Y5P9W5_9MYCO|nr:hypothetical protein MHPYR_230065 [uncultured Mycobacterium sp.]